MFWIYLNLSNSSFIIILESLVPSFAQVTSSADLSAVTDQNVESSHPTSIQNQDFGDNSCCQTIGENSCCQTIGDNSCCQTIADSSCCSIPKYGSRASSQISIPGLDWDSQVFQDLLFYYVKYLTLSIKKTTLCVTTSKGHPIFHLKNALRLL